VLSNPLFLNLAVAGRLRPGQLLECDEEQEVRDLLLDGYLNRTLADQRHYEPEDASRYLAWIARFLNGAEVSPFGLKTSDFTVFDLADLTPPEPPRRYRLFEGLVFGLIFGLVFGLVFGLGSGELTWLVSGLVVGLVFGLILALVLALPNGWLVKRSAVSSRLILASWPSTRRQLLGFLRRAGKGLVLGLSTGLVGGLVFALVLALVYGGLVYGQRGLVYVLWELVLGLGAGLVLGLGAGLTFGLFLGLGSGMLETRSVLITSRTPMEAHSRSLIAALTWLVSGLVGGLVFGLVGGPLLFPILGLIGGLVFGLILGLDLALRNGGWFVLLQKLAHRRLARDGNLPRRLYDFLDWGVDKQVFRRVGGGVRFRHNLIQQHLASTSD